MHYMKLRNEPFLQIKSGQKDIELRLNDEKRQLIKIKDLITFTNVESGECIVTECIGLHRADSFCELFRRSGFIRRGGFEEGLTSKAAADRMKAFYPKEKELMYGVVGIEIKVIQEEKK